MHSYRSNYRIQQSPRLQWFSREQLEEIHSATVEVLERVGVRVDHDEALFLLKEAGCLVRERVVRLPGWLVEECIRLAPSRIWVCNRQGQPALSLESNQTYYGSGSDLPFHLDLESGARRRSLLEDMVRAARLVDALPHYDFVMSYGISSERPAVQGDLHQFAAMVMNCGKPIVFTALSAEHTDRIIDMAAAVAGGYDALKQNPFLILYSEPISPLVHTHDGIAKMFACLEHNIPMIYTPGVVAGGTCPVTKAGTAVQMNAESLSGLVIAQLKKKGAPIIIGGGATPMDMRTSATLYGSPDAVMNYCGMTELSRFYRLPNFTEAGCSNAPLPDAQAGAEAALGLLMNQLCGANLVHDVGYLDGGKTGSLPFLVMCHDYISAVRHIGAGARVDRDTLAAAVIEEVGPAGNYLGCEHTYRHFRSEIWESFVFNRDMYENWVKQGQKNSFDLAREKTFAILESHRPAELSRQALARIQEICP